VSTSYLYSLLTCATEGKGQEDITGDPQEKVPVSSSTGLRVSVIFVRPCSAARFLEDLSRISRGFFEKSPWSTHFLLGFIEDFQSCCIVHNQSILFHSHPYGTGHPWRTSAKALSKGPYHNCCARCRSHTCCSATPSRPGSTLHPVPHLCADWQCLGPRAAERPPSTNCDGAERATTRLPRSFFCTHAPLGYQSDMWVKGSSAPMNQYHCETLQLCHSLHFNSTAFVCRCFRRIISTDI